MQIDLSKQSHVLFFVVFLGAVSVGIGWLCARIIPNAPFWVETISPLTAYGLLFTLFDRVMWHWPVFRWLGIVSQPDLRGRWLGEQISSATTSSGKHFKSRVILEITQSFSRLTAETYYHNWHSHTSAAQFLEIDGACHLVIMFESEPKANYDGDASAHRGVTKLMQLPDTTLTGTYFNAAGNHGELQFRRTSYVLRHTFEGPKPTPRVTDIPS